MEMAMRMKYKRAIDSYMLKQTETMGANQLIHNLWDIWGSDAPTRREIGIYLQTHPNYEKMNDGQYMWVQR
tara:strand:+ start:2208 stop:2420 length:213 start_codon:yes stop_codon:yes gene_type:complete